MSKPITAPPKIRASRRTDNRPRATSIGRKHRGPDIVIEASNSIYSRGRNRATPAKRPTQTVEQFVAQGGKIDRIPSAWDPQ